MVLVFLAPILYTRAGMSTRVYAAANTELNFQARLLTATGGIVPDGNTYSVVFNIYNAATGGTTQWTETQSGLTVKSGYLSVHLGTVTPFPSTIDWTQKQWLTMNINGDGEMSPRLQLTAVPLALRAIQADGITNGASTLTASNLAQLAPGTPQVINSALAALRLNQTGAGALFQLQHNGSDVFSVSNTGDLTSSGSGTFSGGTLNLGTASQAGGVVISDGSSNTGTIKTAALGQNTTYTLPDPGTTTATICLSSGNCGGAGDISQNGNTLGAAITIGTNDAFALNFETGNITRLSIDTSGNVNIVNGSLQTAGTQRIDSTGNLLNIGNISGSGAVNLSSTGGANDLSLTSGSGVINLGASTTIKTTTGLSVDLNNASNQSLTLVNNGAGVANLNLSDGSLLVGNTSVLTNGRALQNLTGISTTGSLVFNSFSGSAGVLSVDGSGNVSVSAASGFEVPLTFNNGLTRTGNTIKLGGTLSAATDIALGGNNLTVSGGGNVGIGSGGPDRKLDVLDASSPQLRLTQTDGSVFVDFQADSSGNLTIDGTGTKTVIADDLQVSGSDILDSGGTSRINLGATTTLTNTTLTLSGTTTIGASSLTTLNTAATLALSGDLQVTGNDLLDSGSTSRITLGSTTTLTNTTLTLAGTTTIGASSLANFNTAATLVFSGDVQINGNDLLDSAGVTRLSLGSTNNLTGNLDVSGSLTAGTANSFQVDTNGSITATSQLLDGSSTSNGNSGALGASSTSLVLNSVTNFDVGNYVQVSSTGCTTGINVCYAKVTAINVGTKTLTISPALVWANASNVKEYYIPEIGGNEGASSVLSQRYGRGYFIAGVVTGNGTTYYNEDGISTSLNVFNLETSDTSGTINIGTGLTSGKVVIGNATGTTTIAGNVTFSGNVTAPTTGTAGYLQRSGTTLSPANAGDNFTTSGNISTSSSGSITAAGGLIAQAGGISAIGNNSLTGGTLTVAGGAITLNTNSNNPTSLNTGSSTGTVTIGGGSAPLVIDSTAFDVSATGALSGITTIGLSGAISGATSTNTINGLVINSGALSNITTINASGAITAATTTNTINGLIINSGTLSGVTGFTQASGAHSVSGTGAITLGGGSNALTIDSTNFDVSSAGALSGITTIGLSGAISGATLTNTINGLVINSGALSNVASITGSGALTIASSGAGNLTFDSASNTIAIAATDTQFQRTASGTFIFDLNDAGATTFQIKNSGIGVANLDLFGGGLSTASTIRLTNAGALQNITTITTSGNINTSAGVYQVGGTSGLTIAACTAGQYIGNGVATKGGLITAGTCRNDGIASDVRLKKDISSVGSVLDRIKDVNIVSFNYKVEEMPELNLDHGLQYGVIAQELEQLFPELVSTGQNGYKEINFRALSFYNIKAVGELATRVDSLSQNMGATTANINATTVSTNSTLRLDETGVLQNINGLNLVGGGASVVGGINNHDGGITRAGAIQGATTIEAQAITVNADASSSILSLKKDGQGVFTVFNNGALGLQLDAANAFGVKDAAGIAIFTIDSQHGKVVIGSGDASKTVQFTLDNRSTPDDPANGTNGSSYYNAALQRFRCYQDGRWQDCLPVGDLNEPISSDQVTWTQPSVDQEFPGTPRIVADLSRAHEFRLRIRLTSPGAASASCRLQYASSDTGPWNDIAATGGNLSLAQAGTIRTEWLKLDEGARKEDTLVRVMCKNGDAAHSTVFYGVSMQLR